MIKKFEDLIESAENALSCAIDANRPDLQDYYIGRAQALAQLATAQEMRSIATELMNLNEEIRRNGLTVEIVNSEYK